MEIVLLAAIGYLFGSIPFGLIAGRLRGTDIRAQGSGRTGSANVLRILGPRMAVTVFFADLSKGAVPVAIAAFLFDSSSAEVAAGLAAVAGHNWSMFARFKGGRGVVVALGAALFMIPWVALSGFGLFIIVVVLSRYVSLASIIGVSTAGILMVILAVARIEPWVYAVFGSIGMTIIVIQHKDNIARLLRGSERRVGRDS